MLAKAVLFAAVLVAAPAFAQPVPPAPPAPPMAPLAPLPPAPPEPPAPPSAWDGGGYHIHWGSHEGWSEKDRAKFDLKMKALDEKLARLDVRLKAEEAAREIKMKAILARAEDHARYAAAAAAKAEMSPERIRSITERAMAEAHAGERAAQAAERAIEAIQPRLDALSRQLDSLDMKDADPVN